MPFPLSELLPWIGAGVLGAVTSAWVLRRRWRIQQQLQEFQRQAEINLWQQREQTLRAELAQARQDLATHGSAVVDNAALTARLEALHEAKLAAEQRWLLEQGRAEAFAQRAQESVLAQTQTEGLLQAERTRFAEREAALKDAEQRLQQVFQGLAEQVIESRGAHQKQEIETLLSPMREHLTDLKRHLAEMQVQDAKERGSLVSEIKSLQLSSERINREAANLTSALKGDRRLQGTWGELVLTRVLEASGLREGSEYVAQVSKSDALGERRRPDVIVHLPEGRSVVIDAKVSLTAYERALSQDNPDERARHLKQHALDLREQVRRLAKQDYDQLNGLRSLDFVLLFVPVEAALSAASQADDQLLIDALSQRVLVVSPTTLMMSLRIIQNLWRSEHQRKNVLEIARKAGDLYDKVRLLVNDVQRLGQQIDTLRGTYGDLTHKLWSDRNNLVKQAEEFKVLGAETRKAIAAEAVELAILHNEAANDESPESGSETNGT